MPILKIMEVMGVQAGPKSMAYAQTYNHNDYRIMRAEKENVWRFKTGQFRRAEKLAENDVWRNWRFTLCTRHSWLV